MLPILAFIEAISAGVFTSEQKYGWAVFCGLMCILASAGYVADKIK